MLGVYYCIQNEHDPRLVFLAALICVVTSGAVVLLLRHARDSKTKERRLWLSFTGLASGFGIWATHFIAMMGYDPGIVVGYTIGPTVGSLLVAIASSSCGFAISLRSRAAISLWGAGGVIGTGIAGMHYLGVQAVALPGEIRWSSIHITASIVFAIVPIVPALHLMLKGSSKASAAGSSGLLASAIVLLHFTGMAGITVIPSPFDEQAPGILSPFAMGLAVATGALVVLTFGILATLMSARSRTVIEASEREFRLLVQGITDCAIYMLTPDGRVTNWNAGAERLKGYSRAEAVGLELGAFYSPEDRAAGAPERGLQHARQHGKFSAQGWRYRKDGSRFWAHVTIEAVHDDQGGFRGFAKITRDMTAFKEHQDNLDAALSNMHQGLCLFGADERLVIANDRVSAIFGVSSDNYPSGTSFDDMFRTAFEQSVGGGDSERFMEALVRHREMISRPGGGKVIVPFKDDMTLSISHRPMAGGGPLLVAVPLILRCGDLAVFDPMNLFSGKDGRGRGDAQSLLWRRPTSETRHTGRLVGFGNERAKPSVFRAHENGADRCQKATLAAKTGNGTPAWRETAERPARAIRAPAAIRQ